MGRTYSEIMVDVLMEKMRDPKTTILSKEGMDLICHITNICREAEGRDEKVSKLVYMMLLRLRVASPHAFAITVGQFRDFDGIEDYWAKYGYVDHDGFVWIARSTGGRR